LPVRAERSVVSGEVFVTASGDGLLLREDGGAEASVPGRLLHGAIHGDRVRAEIVREAPAWTRFRRGGRPGRPTAEVREILARGPRRLTGRLRRTPAGDLLDPDDAKLPPGMVLDPPPGVPDGTALVAELLPVDPADPARVRARAIATFSGRVDVAMEIERLLVRERLEAEFPPEAAAQAAAVTAASLLRGPRRDLGDLPFVTIDPEDARDHDDAVAVLPAADGGGRGDLVDVWVAIADVSAAVPPGSALDAEARARGLSIYLPDRVIRMLPEALSADACSLRPGEDRAVLAVRVRLDPRGRQAGATEIVRGAIRSRARLTYAQAAALLSAGGAEAEAPPLPGEVRESLERADRVARTLRALRLAAGSLDLDQPEPRVVLDDAGGVLAIRRRAASAAERDAYRLIEELMLLANRAVARLLLGRGAPAIYRVHEPPAAEELRRFARIARHYGIPLRADRAAEPRALAAALDAMRPRPFGEALAGLALRALKQARYAPQNLGHYGLAFREYLHFTSPIRRYPDLAVHRVTSALLDGASPAELDALAAREALGEAAARASARERRAMLVEREAADLYGAWLMRDRVGETYEGTVTGAGAAGVFVRLADPFVEGLVALEDLPADDWRFFADEVRLWGPETGLSFRLGDAVRVSVIDSSVARRRTFFGLAPPPARPGRRRS
jgi:ribonuclease R